MELVYFVNLIFIFVINILFFFSGICLNSLVIVSFWRSAQLRKKLCYFTIMVLSCCDLLVVLTNHPFLAFVTILWLTEKIYKYPAWLLFPYCLLNMFTGSFGDECWSIFGDTLSHFSSNICDLLAVTKALIGGGGGCIFIYSRSARRISFEIDCNDNWFQKKFVGQNANIWISTPPPPQLTL